MDKTYVWELYRDPPANEHLGLFWKFLDAIREAERLEGSEIHWVPAFDRSGGHVRSGLWNLRRSEVK